MLTAQLNEFTLGCASGWVLMDAGRQQTCTQRN
jgi:hypothetical protein